MPKGENSMAGYSESEPAEGQMHSRLGPRLASWGCDMCSPMKNDAQKGPVIQRASHLV